MIQEIIPNQGNTDMLVNNHGIFFTNGNFSMNTNDLQIEITEIRLPQAILKSKAVKLLVTNLQAQIGEYSVISELTNDLFQKNIWFNVRDEAINLPKTIGFVTVIERKNKQLREKTYAFWETLFGSLAMQELIKDKDFSGYPIVIHIPIEGDIFGAFRSLLSYHGIEKDPKIVIWAPKD